MERVLKRFAIVVGLGGAGLIAIISIAPHGEAAFIIQRFQTLLGGILATIAAAFTAYVVHASAVLPVRAEDKRREDERKEREKVYAAVLAHALNDVREYIHKPGNVTMPEDYEFPVVLSDPNAITTQEPIIANEIVQSVSIARQYLREEVHKATKTREPARKAAIDALDDTVNMLGPIAGIYE